MNNTSLPPVCHLFYSVILSFVQSSHSPRNLFVFRSFAQSLKTAPSPTLKFIPPLPPGATLPCKLISEIPQVSHSERLNSSFSRFRGSSVVHTRGEFLLGPPTIQTSSPLPFGSTLCTPLGPVSPGTFGHSVDSLYPLSNLPRLLSHRTRPSRVLLQ